MCDKSNNDACDIVYDLQLEVDNLNGKIAELKAELWKNSSLNQGNTRMPEGMF